MRVTKPRVKLILDVDPIKNLKKIERCGRLCYKSGDKITSDSYIDFIKNIIKRGHLSVIEHSSVTALVICDRGVSHEIVRHRIGSYSQESTRYCKYNKEDIEVIQPPIKDKVALAQWEAAMIHAEQTYAKLILAKEPPEIARSVLPNALKTEIAITYNFREWLHFLEIRGSKRAHPQIREIAILLLEELKKYFSIIFNHLVVEEGLIVRRIQ